MYLQSVSDEAPWSLKILSFILTLSSAFLIMPIIRSYVTPGWLCSAFVRAELNVCEDAASRLSS